MGSSISAFLRFFVVSLPSSATSLSQQRFSNLLSFLFWTFFSSLNDSCAHRQIVPIAALLSNLFTATLARAKYDRNRFNLAHRLGNFPCHSTLAHTNVCNVPLLGVHSCAHLPKSRTVSSERNPPTALQGFFISWDISSPLRLLLVVIFRT